MRSSPIVLLFASVLPAQVRADELVARPANWSRDRFAFDSAGQRVLGLSWVDGSLAAAPAGTANWTLVSTTTHPSARYTPLFVYDDARQRVVMFGGFVPSQRSDVNETWEFDGANWQQQAPAHSPSARSIVAGCYRADRGTVIAHGGVTTTILGQQFHSDTWEYDGTDWRQIASGGPSLTPGVMLAADTGRGVLVARSGVTTWEFGAGGWTSIATANQPGDRIGPALGYDPRRRRIVLFAGRDRMTSLQRADFWEYDGTDWTQRQPIQAPMQGRFEATLLYDPAAHAMLAVGGYSQTGDFARTLANVVRYGPVVDADDTAFGIGCPGSSNDALRTDRLPFLGGALRLSVAAAQGLPALFALGLSNTTFAGQPLPMALVPLGIQGCQLLVSLDGLDLAFGRADGRAVADWSVPNLPSLLGAVVFAQAALPGSGTSSGMVVTHGLRLVVGSN